MMENSDSKIIPAPESGSHYQHGRQEPVGMGEKNTWAELRINNNYVQGTIRSLAAEGQTAIEKSGEAQKLGLVELAEQHRQRIPDVMRTLYIIARNKTFRGIPVTADQATRAAASYAAIHTNHEKLAQAEKQSRAVLDQTTISEDQARQILGILSGVKIEQPIEVKAIERKTSMISDEDCAELARAMQDEP